MKRLAAILAAATITAAAVAAHAATPARVVSVGGSTTEIVYALGAGESLVGVDTTSLYPSAATELPNIGYVRQLSAEGLLSLKPDLLLTGSEAGPPAALQQAEAIGVPIVKMSEGYTPEAVERHIETVGKALGREQEAAELRAAFAEDIAAVNAEIAKTTSKPRVLFVLQTSRGAMLVSGTDTAASAMIELAGGVNAVTEFSGYKPFSPEAATLAAPDVILMSDQTVETLGGTEIILAEPAFQATPAGQNGRVVMMDALYLAGFGPRLAHALHDLAAALHPEHEFAPLPARPWTEAQ
ncbi:periplasmic binding protein [Parvibaculum lavamentivorans DS-1]|uniref:Periplasmic binding protein n=1 Tax=Parvibaculum lavamentivorans (strain DS-1 / DSM 13023 / NCIMB 13966) TaxID=402881 RepID=A7HPH2_PARL1|nr:ABC transporter substrate-binding protein [Parvibaculum lavamentivorans]ABS61805.1 periplasmic binding protein [Parvibaculum lavamentivorans DS-1]